MAFLDLGQLIKQKFPGAYDDVPDVQLGKQVATKYPQYQDIVSGKPNAALNQVPETAPDTGSIGGFLSNLGSDALQTAKGIGTAVIHPINTLKNIGTLGAGEVQLGVNKLSGITPNTAQLPSFMQNAQQTAQGFNKQLKGQYGSADAIGQSAYYHPVQTLLDVASLLGGVGGAIGKVGDVSDLSKVADVGKTLQGASDVLNPVNNVVKGTQKVTNGVAGGAGNVITGILGTTTGAGGQAIKQALTNGSKEFLDAMRGNTSADQTINDIKDSLQTVKDNRRTDWLKNFPDQATQPIDTAPIRQSFDNQLGGFNIDRAEDGSLDFTHSSVSTNPSAQSEITAMDNRLKLYEKNPEQANVKNLQAFKQSVNDEFKPSSSTRAIVAGTSKAINGALSTVPGYSEATTAYKKASDLLDELKTVTGSDKAARTTTLNRVLSIVRNDKEAGIQLLNELSNASGKDLTGQIAGTLLNSTLPEGFLAKLGAYGTAGVGVLAHAAPELAAGLLTTSPRLVGETARVAGRAGRAVGKVTGAVGKAARAGTQSSALNALLSHLGAMQQ